VVFPALPAIAFADPFPAQDTAGPKARGRAPHPAKGFPMKKLLLSMAALAALAVTGGSANAQGPAPGCQDCSQGSGGYGYGYGFGGFMPQIKKPGFFSGGMFSGIFTNHGSVFGGGQRQQIPVADPRNAGQLVFPQNPFVRSPRDFFMWDER
jgi:hypothetical protein